MQKWTDPKLAPYSDAAYFEHLRQNLRKAGLPERAAPHDEKLSIAVLPFDYMSGDPEQDYFSDGITEDIIAELSKFREFLVIARNSSFQFRGKANDVADVAKKLGCYGDSLLIPGRGPRLRGCRMRSVSFSRRATKAAGPSGRPLVSARRSAFVAASSSGMATRFAKSGKRSGTG